MKKGDIVVLTNHDIKNGEWPEEYVHQICRIVSIEEFELYAPVVVECLDPKLLEYRKKYGDGPTFNSPASGLFRLEHISPDNKLLRLVL